jgi:Protein of unknown function (DUF1360)
LPDGGCPERIAFGDTARSGLASYKIGRLVAKDEVASWVRRPSLATPKRESRSPRACPYCLGVWAASGLSYALVLYPRQTRLVTTIFGAQADFLNAAFVKLKRTKPGSDPN